MAIIVLSQRTSERFTAGDVADKASTMSEIAGQTRTKNIEEQIFDTTFRFWLSGYLKLVDVGPNKYGEYMVGIFEARSTLKEIISTVNPKIQVENPMSDHEEFVALSTHLRLAVNLPDLTGFKCRCTITEVRTRLMKAVIVLKAMKDVSI
ncbi:hypothetical protein BJ165DRAFT_1410362 [Panaeolus papilionaceus]|nr:hypothetical protein BJ165DRAFT_1410362 [Panaeolus papilionaceus]